MVMRAGFRSIAALELRNGAPHELVEERHRERHVAVGWAVDHPFLDEARAHHAEGGDLHTQTVGDVSRPVWPWPELRHRAQIGFLPWREPVEAHAEEVLVQALARNGRRLTHVPTRDRRSRCVIPRLVSPLLEKVRIAPR